MNEKIIGILKDLPAEPGVYEMLDSFQRVIYVGKSVNLRNRVRSYFLKNPKWHKAKSMQPFISDIRINRADTDLEARYLECIMIHELQPFYNSQMKRSKKSFYFSFDHDREPLTITPWKGGGRVGPLKNIHRLKKLQGDLSCLYPFKMDRGKIVFHFSPIPARVTEEEYRQTKEVLESVFNNPLQYEKLLTALEEKMLESSKEFLFERAAFYRDLILNLTSIEREIHQFSRFIKREYLFSLKMEKGEKLFYIREGLIEESCQRIEGKYKNVVSEEKVIEPRLKAKLQRVVYQYISNLKDSDLEDYRI